MRELVVILVSGPTAQSVRVLDSEEMSGTWLSEFSCYPEDDEE